MNGKKIFHNFVWNVVKERENTFESKGWNLEHPVEYFIV